MANHKATKKSIRKTAKRRLQNRYYAKTMRNSIREFKLLTEKKEAEPVLSKLISLIDKVAKRNQIHNNKASNLKSKMMKSYNDLK
ncbi:MAG: small subunit ribosomal protein S20 [Planctomycetota bacterium]|jgi:small subunit ribosomal protein S20